MSYFCYQGNDKDCGFASLKMLLANLSHNKHYLNISKEPSKKEGFTFYDLTEIAKQYGVELTSYRVDFDGLLTLPTPLLVMLKENHLVYLKAIRGRSVIIYDPGEGKKRMKRTDFLSMFAGYVLSPTISESGIKECRCKAPVIVPFYKSLIQYAITLAMGGVLMAGFYFLKDDSNFLLVIGFLLAIIISELVDNWYIIKNIKYFDNTFLPQYFTRKENRTKERYEEYIDFKKDYFGANKSIGIACLFTLVFSTLLIVNDLRNILVIALIAIFRIADHLIFRKGDESFHKHVANLEMTAFESDNLFTRNLLKANDESSSFSARLSARKCVNTFFIAVAAVLMMVFNKLVSTNYVLFHFGIYYVISNSFDSLVTFAFSRKRIAMKKARFLDSCDL